MGKAQVQRVGRQTDRQTDMPISVQEQKDKPSKIYTYQQPVPKLKNAYLDFFVVVLVMKI